jgi:hypothetical protein
MVEELTSWKTEVEEATLKIEAADFYLPNYTTAHA